MGNNELDSVLFAFKLGRTVLNKSNVISRFIQKFSRRAPFEEELTLIASHFYELGSIESFSVEQLEIILQNEYLKLESEDWLLHFIRSLGSDYHILLRYIRCEFPACESMPLYVESISLGDVDSILWFSVCRRLLRSQPLFISSERFPTGQIPILGSRLDGSLRYVTNECAGNIHKKGSVVVTASGTDQRNVIYVVNFEEVSCWLGLNDADSWIRFDLKDNCTI
jgi:hypothetical protein